MTTITTRAGKGSALTHQELDDNFSNLNTAKLESGDVANVAITGEYSDLANVPAIPTHTSNLTNDSGFITTATANVTSVNGQTGAVSLSIPTHTSNLTNDSGFITNSVTGDLSTTGNVTVGGNLNISGRVYDTSGVFQVDSVGNIALVPTGSVQLYGPTDVIGGKLTTGAVTYANTDGTAGQVLTTYGNGITYFSTVSGGSGSLEGNAVGNINMMGYSLSNAASISTDVISSMTGDYVTLEGVIANNGIQTAGNISNPSGPNVTINDDLVVAGNIYSGSLKSVWVGSVQLVNNSGAPAGMIIGGSVGIAGAADAHSFTVNNGNINIEDANRLKFFDSDNSNFVALKSPATVASDVTWTLPSADGSSGQVLKTDGAGNLGWVTASGGGGGSPGGSDTQIQFNDGGSFGGNVAMTFDDTSGNINLGNIRINGDTIRNTDSFQSNTRPNPGVINVGPGPFGDWGNTYDNNNSYRNAAILRAGGNVTVTGGANLRWQGTNLNLFAKNESGSRITDSTRVYGAATELHLIGPNSFGATTNSNPFNYQGHNVVTIAGDDTVANANANVACAMAVGGGVSPDLGSTIVDGIAILPNAFGSGTLNNWYGVTFNGTVSGSVSNVYLIHNQAGTAGTHNSGWGMNDNMRSASRYYFIRNDDNASQIKLGSLRFYHEFRYALTSSSGAVTINKSQGQVQYTAISEDITSVSFSNFVISASDGSNTDYETDTVTWIIEQGATPYNITMPTGSQYKYAGGINTVTGSANGCTMITITAFQDLSASIKYLITISPEFT